jgi:hypothetical protein
MLITSATARVDYARTRLDVTAPFEPAMVLVAIPDRA